jgi:hypothetical protein
MFKEIFILFSKFFFILGHYFEFHTMEYVMDDGFLTLFLKTIMYIR